VLAIIDGLELPTRDHEYWSISGSSTLAQEHHLIVAIARRTKSIFLESIQSVILQESCRFAVLGLQVAVAAQSS
jgi:hypothetical protein